MSARGHFATGEALLFEAESEQDGSPVRASVTAQLATAHYLAAIGQILIDTADRIRRDEDRGQR